MADKTYLYYREHNNHYDNWQRVEINEFGIPQSYTEATIKLLELGVIQDDKVYEIANNINYQLIVYLDFNWADEIDFKQKAVFDFNDWFEFLQLFNDNPHLEIEIYVGTNQQLIVSSYTFRHVKTILAHNTFANAVKNYNLEHRNIVDKIYEALYYALDEDDYDEY